MPESGWNVQHTTTLKWNDVCLDRFESRISFFPTLIWNRAMLTLRIFLTWVWTTLKNRFFVSFWNFYFDNCNKQNSKIVCRHTFNDRKGFNNIYFESSGKWNWRRWKWRLPLFANQTLHNSHSRPPAWFLNLSLMKWVCRCFTILDDFLSLYGHRLQKCFWSSWLDKICWRSSEEVRKKLEQILHFHGCCLSRTSWINAFALSFAFALDLRLAFSFFVWIDWFGANWISDFWFSSSDSESVGIIIGSDISGDRSRLS